MKLSLATLSLIEAAKNGRGGKHGNVDLDGERFNWKIPKCIQNKDVYCTSEKTYTKNDSIMFNKDNYKNYENHLFQIKAPEGFAIKLQFDKDHGFGMEYHNKCGYDKLHIFKGNLETFDQKNRIARFCGPKQNGNNGATKPWDGAQKVFENFGELPMWDKAYNTYTNEVIVAVDFDQDVDGLTGFKLDWTFERTSCPDFTDFQEAAAWAHDEMIRVTGNLNWNPARNNKAQKKMENRIEYSRGRVAKRSKQFKKCNKNWNDDVSTSMASTWAEMCNCPDIGPDYLTSLIDTFTDLMAEYNGECTNMKHWNKRQSVLHGLMDDGLTADNVSAEGDCEDVIIDDKPEIPEGYTEHNTAWGTVYTKIYDDFYTMEEGQALCAADATEDFTPHMPIPMDIYQNDFFFNLVGLKTDRDLWLGINDKENEGVWMNDLGNQQFFFNWRNGEPGNKKGRDEDNVEMILSGDDSANGGPFNGLWNDKFNNPYVGTRYNQNNNNMVVCTFTVPDSEPASECGYGWEGHETSEGRKCLQINKGEYKIQTAIDMCSSQDAQLVQPKNDADNKLYADLIGYNNYDLWVAGYCTKSEGGCAADEWVNMHDNSALTYTNWNEKNNEPNNNKGGPENYIQLILTDGDSYDEGVNGKWNDARSRDDQTDINDRIAMGRNNAFICVKN